PYTLDEPAGESRIKGNNNYACKDASIKRGRPMSARLGMDNHRPMERRSEQVSGNGGGTIEHFGIGVSTRTIDALLHERGSSAVPSHPKDVFRKQVMLRLSPASPVRYRLRGPSSIC